MSVLKTNYKLVNRLIIFPYFSVFHTTKFLCNVDRFLNSEIVMCNFLFTFSRIFLNALQYFQSKEIPL